MMGGGHGPWWGFGRQGGLTQGDTVWWPMPSGPCSFRSLRLYCLGEGFAGEARRISLEIK